MAETPILANLGPTEPSDLHKRTAEQISGVEDFKVLGFHDGIIFTTVASLPTLHVEKAEEIEAFMAPYSDRLFKTLGVKPEGNTIRTSTDESPLYIFPNKNLYTPEYNNTLRRDGFESAKGEVTRVVLLPPGFEEVAKAYADFWDRYRKGEQLYDQSFTRLAHHVPVVIEDGICRPVLPEPKSTPNLIGRYS